MAGEIGASLPRRTALVERGMMALFMKAVGETGRHHTDRDWMRAQGHPDVMAPSTYLLALKLGVLPATDFLTLAGAEIDFGRSFHAEQRFLYHAPAYVGDELAFVETLTDIYRKKDGALTFYVGDTEVRNQHGAHVADLRLVSVLTA